MEEPLDYEKAIAAQKTLPHVDPLELESITKQQGSIDKLMNVLQVQKEHDRDSGFVDSEKPDDTQPAVNSTETYEDVQFVDCNHFTFSPTKEDYHRPKLQEGPYADSGPWLDRMEDNPDRFKLVKSQQYFDFVPPPLNDFEYAMTKLSKIEKSLLRQFPMQESEPSLHRLMSFSFVHGNHLDTKQASLALFDAEPDERKNDQNKSGIVVVYLGKDVTFEMLTDMTRNTGYLDIQGDDKFVAVLSEELLRDRSRLRSILRPILGGGLKIIDVNREMDKLFKRFEDLTSQAFTDMRKLITDVKEKYKEDEMLRTIEKQFSALYKLHNEDNKKHAWRSSNKLRWSKSTFQSLKKQGLQGYTISSGFLILCFECRNPPCKRGVNIPQEILQKFKHIKIIEVEEPFFKYHHTVEGGDKLHPFGNNKSKYGSVGMFGSVSNSDGSSKTCCISSPHVISCGQTAYISGAKVPLGNCIWPPIAENNCINVEDISVIYLDLVHKNIEIRKMFEKQITLFEGDRNDLKRRKVYKFGATTFKTIGFIQDPEFMLPFRDGISVFLIEPEDVDDDSSRFSQPGDSGAIVFTKFGQNVVALSMIFGGDLTLEGFAKNNSIAVDLQQAIQRFADHNKDKSLQLNTL
uniref:Uncharacterized protein LOC111104392 isoform X1 n=1 Tax=Crassostrea virginica TaxID=6565 RepID=A0A8B8AUU1_CRAVI|nr:uncharacterized protein LOC111104392 isoform X1 [Crassostrea virginica]